MAALCFAAVPAYVCLIAQRLRGILSRQRPRGSSPVVPAIFFKHLQEINKTNLGPFGSNKQFPPYWTSFDLLAKNKPVGKIAPTSLSCAIRLLSAVACRYLLVTCRLLCRR